MVWLYGTNYGVIWHFEKKKWFKHNYVNIIILKIKYICFKPSIFSLCKDQKKIINVHSNDFNADLPVHLTRKNKTKHDWSLILFDSYKVHCVTWV